MFNLIRDYALEIWMTFLGTVVVTGVAFAAYTAIAGW